MIKQQSNNEVFDILIKLQEQVSALDKKVDLLMGRMMATPALMTNTHTPNLLAEPPRKDKPQYQIICADCGKEATLHFKPNADRPVYCKDCYLLRKRSAVVSVVKDGPIRAEDSYMETAPLSPIKETAKAPSARERKKVPAKRPAARPKPAPRRKK